MKFASRFKKTSAVLAAAVFIVSLPFTAQLSVSAASYEGKGTKSSPYLVETAQQLDMMRQNLSAHYKLANTIDMSSFGKFTPIGNEGEKFTGSFTCDTNSDGTPKYAVKNLKVYIDAGEKYGHKLYNAASYSDYAEGKNKWQAGLFGFTSGATIKNIAVLNADVTNTVLGQNKTNPDYSVNPGGDKGVQSAGVLIGSAVKTTVTGCSATGNINSKNNCTGGLIGYAEEGSISNCYSKVNVKSTGFWFTGGLLGSCNTNVSGCFATGTVSGGSTETTTGGLIGAIEEGSSALITSCYSTGTISPSASGFSLIGFRTTFSAWEKNVKEKTANMINCYATGNVTGLSAVQVGSFSSDNNNLILSSSTGRQDGFKAASMTEIKSAMASVSDYDTSGDMPRLKKTVEITDESKYAPGAVSETAQNAQAANNSDTASSSDGDSKSESSQSAQEVEEMIKNLPQANEFTIKNKDALKKAKRAYDSLSDSEKEKISAESAAKLSELYNTASALILKDIKKNVDALPKVSKLKASDYDKVMAIYDDYEFLNKETQGYLTKDVKDKLLSAVKKVKDLKEGSDTSNSSVSALELAFIIVLSVLIILILAFNVVWSVWIIRKNKSVKNEKQGDVNEG